MDNIVPKPDTQEAWVSPALDGSLAGVGAPDPGLEDSPEIGSPTKIFAHQHRVCSSADTISNHSGYLQSCSDSGESFRDGEGSLPQLAAGVSLEALVKKALSAAGPAQPVDWAAPGTALHEHLRQQQRIAGTPRMAEASKATADPTAQSSPPASLSRPATSSKKTQKARIGPTQRAKRVPKFAFGGRDQAAQHQLPEAAPAGASLQGPTGRRVVQARSAADKQDPWLADWQPKAKLKAEAVPKPERHRASLAAKMTPPLDWALPASGSLADSMPAPLAAAQAGTAQRGISKMPAKLAALKRKPVLKIPLPDSPLPPAANANSESPKQAAVQRLAQLRNLRRIPLQPVSMSAPTSTAASPSPAPHSLYSDRRISAQPLQSASAPLATIQSAPSAVLRRLASSLHSPADLQGQPSFSGKQVSRQATATIRAQPALRKQLSVGSRAPKDGVEGSGGSSSAGLTPPISRSILGDAAAIQPSLFPAARAELSTMLGPGLKACPATGTASSGLAPAAGRERAVAASDLIRCEGCGRSFNQKAHGVHSRACAKVFRKQQAAYAADKATTAPVLTAPAHVSNSPAASVGQPSAQTASLAALPAVAAAPPHKRQQVAKAVPQGSIVPIAAQRAGKMVPKWKQQSAQLQAAMLAARPAQLGKAAAAFPGAVEVDQSLVPCPHCGRRFNEQAAERHIASCKDTVHKASRLLAGSGRGAHSRPAGSNSKAAGSW